jgi:hypothetical protein
VINASGILSYLTLLGTVMDVPAYQHLKLGDAPIVREDCPVMGTLSRLRRIRYPGCHGTATRSKHVNYARTCASIIPV